MKSSKKVARAESGSITRAPDVFADSVPDIEVAKAGLVIHNVPVTTEEGHVQLPLEALKTVLNLIEVVRNVCKKLGVRLGKAGTCQDSSLVIPLEERQECGQWTLIPEEKIPDLILLIYTFLHVGKELIQATGDLDKQQLLSDDRIRKIGGSVLLKNLSAGDIKDFLRAVAAASEEDVLLDLGQNVDGQVREIGSLSNLDFVPAEQKPEKRDNAEHVLEVSGVIAHERIVFCVGGVLVKIPDGLKMNYRRSNKIKITGAIARAKFREAFLAPGSTVEVVSMGLFDE